MGLWKCGKCGRVYTTEELMELKHVPLNPKAKDPRKEGGFVPVCTCGYVFGRDKWHLVDIVKTPRGTFRVSTVFLELEHPNGMWYETMIFGEDGLRLDIEPMWRYATQQEAEENHKRIVEALKNGRFKLRPVEFQLEIEL